jgi:hypothetical protein
MSDLQATLRDYNLVRFLNVDRIQSELVKQELYD